MPGAIDLSGQRFGRLTVTGRSVSRNGVAMWLCRCDCGNDAVVTCANLRRGETRSCGCLVKQRAQPADPADLIGRRFGKLTVIARNRTTRRARWDCVCDCGNTSTADQDHLLRGVTRSCGCGVHAKLDLVGQQFGHYTVIERHQAGHQLQWVCRCDCGAVVKKTTWQLRNHPDDGHEGCPFGPEAFQHGQPYRPLDDLTGRTFGLLHVLRLDKEASAQLAVPQAMWVCRCECGTVKTIRGYNLTSGKTRTCRSAACQKILRERNAALWASS